MPTVAAATAVLLADYAAARQRFRQAASGLGWRLEAHPIGGALGPGGEGLALDVGCSPDGDPRKVLVVSSGMHGVEGPLGSAVQAALLEQWAAAAPPPIKLVFLHALNPFGFAWRRRSDEHNVDLNRNFLLPGERFEGASEAYARLDAFLNPRRPPCRWEPFTVKAASLIARNGMPALRQAVAEGQYSYPCGLFYGGAGPSPTQRRLGELLPRLLQGSQCVVHIDFHTGLGRRGGCTLLTDYPLGGRQRGWLTDWYGAGAFQPCDPSGIAYSTRGGFGRWCVSGGLAPDYLFVYAEFGTYGPVEVLAGLRAENQAHHWGSPTAASTIGAKQRLQELFCPAAPAWRSQAVGRGLELVGRAQRGLVGLALPGRADRR